MGAAGSLCRCPKSESAAVHESNSVARPIVTEISATAAPKNSSLDSPDTLIIGRQGRLAKALRHVFPKAQAAGRETIDITDRASVERAVAAARPAIVINCAAVTDLVLCERDPAATRRVNVDGVANLAVAAAAAGALLVHISSDYAANPVNEYGRGKRDSEAFGDLAIRAKIYDGSHWAWQALRNGQPIRMTTAETCNPISTTGLAKILPNLIGRRLRGVVALGTVDRLTLFEVGQIWAEALGVSRDLVEPVGAISSLYRRPSDTFMPVTALAGAGIAVPSLASDAASHCAQFAVYGA